MESNDIAIVKVERVGKFVLISMGFEAGLTFEESDYMGFEFTCQRNADETRIRWYAHEFRFNHPCDINSVDYASKVLHAVDKIQDKYIETAIINDTDNPAVAIALILRALGVSKVRFIEYGKTPVEYPGLKAFTSVFDWSINSRDAE